MVALSIFLNDNLFVGPPHMTDKTACPQILPIFTPTEFIHAMDTYCFGIVSRRQVEVFPYS